MGVALMRRSPVIVRHRNTVFTCIVAEMIAGAVENGVGKSEGDGGTAAVGIANKK